VSASSFVNALIGLARDHKRKQNFLKKRPGANILAEWHKVHHAMVQSGYFKQDEIEQFATALKDLFQTSDPRRKKGQS